MQIFELSFCEDGTMFQVYDVVELLYQFSRESNCFSRLSLAQDFNVLRENCELLPAPLQPELFLFSYDLSLPFLSSKKFSLPRDLLNPTIS